MGSPKRGNMLYAIINCTPIKCYICIKILFYISTMLYYIYFIVILLLIRKL